MAKEKAKERKEAKERKVKRKQDGGLCLNPSKSAHARASVRARRRPCTCTYREAGEAAAEIVCNCFPHRVADIPLRRRCACLFCLRFELALSDPFRIRAPSVSCPYHVRGRGTRIA